MSPFRRAGHLRSSWTSRTVTCGGFLRCPVAASAMLDSPVPSRPRPLHRPWAKKEPQIDGVGVGRVKTLSGEMVLYQFKPVPSGLVGVKEFYYVFFQTSPCSWRFLAYLG